VPIAGRSWRLASVVFLALSLVLGVGLVISLQQDSNGLPRAVAFGGLPQVGALFDSRSNTTHTCTASVVESLAGNLALTAAHCLSGSIANYVFAPMLRDGAIPYGKWQVNGAYVDPRWRSTHDPHADYAFLTITPQVRRGRLTSIQSAVGGGNPLQFNGGLGVPALVVGYPAGVGGSPIMCAVTTYDHLGYPSFDCDGYVDGTSGGPWLIVSGSSPDKGAIYGVIGGLQEGGSTPSTSYSSPFDSSTEAVYACALGLAHGSRCADMHLS
jgi:V8-like Glu-specific endopeptidase